MYKFEYKDGIRELSKTIIENQENFDVEDNRHLLASFLSDFVDFVLDFGYNKEDILRAAVVLFGKDIAE